MQNNKYIIILLFFIPFLSSCFILSDESGNTEVESLYTAQIAWESDTFIIRYAPGITLEGTSLYVYEDMEDKYDADFRLVKLDANTGSVIWRTESFPMIQLRAPIVIAEYVYVFIEPSLIYSYDTETGELSAIIETDTEHMGIFIEYNAISYGKYLYFAIGGATKNYLARLDTAAIDRSGNPSKPQNINPEVVWIPESKMRVKAEPVIRENVIYCLTYSGLGRDNPIEFGGINMDTKQIVWHKWIDYDNGIETYSLLTHEDNIYILSKSISAYNFNTGELLFLKIFSNKTPEREMYAASFSLGGVYHKGKIYYTNSEPKLLDESDFRNIICIDAKTGELVWNDVARRSDSMGTNPLIINDRMYVPHFYGLRVYDTNTGKLVGVDKSFIGSGSARNILYKNYMITIRRESITGIGKIVAIKLGG